MNDGNPGFIPPLITASIAIPPSKACKLDTLLSDDKFAVASIFEFTVPPEGTPEVGSETMLVGWTIDGGKVNPGLRGILPIAIPLESNIYSSFINF